MENNKDIKYAFLYNNAIAIGLCLGLLIGIFTDNIGLWLSLGLVFGASTENAQRNKKKKK